MKQSRARLNDILTTLLRTPLNTETHTSGTAHCDGAAVLHERNGGQGLVEHHHLEGTAMAAGNGGAPSIAS